MCSPIRAVEGVDTIADCGFSQNAVVSGVIWFAVLWEVFAESGTLAMPSFTVPVAGAWIEVTEELHTLVIRVKAATLLNLLLLLLLEQRVVL